MKMPEVEVLGDGPGKPEAIERFTGRRPIFAFGNSDGDREMLEWTAAGSGVRFVGLCITPMQSENGLTIKIYWSWRVH